MSWAIIGTWRMALEGIEKAAELLVNRGNSGDAVETAIKMVEDFPYYKSVGYGGLPNENGEVELDAAFMNGDTLSIGAVGGIKNFKNPISIAKKLSKEEFNCFLIGQGAEEYADKNGFERKNMLTDRAIIHYKNRLKETADKRLTPYKGHDTVGIVSLDLNDSMACGTSTSGLFMKKRGRLGDSPLVGSGFYVDSEIGGAVATGLGEDIMKGCISYEIVRLMGEGCSPQEAADKAVFKLNNILVDRRKKSGDISVVCINNRGEFGAATNAEGFSFVVATEKLSLTAYVCSVKDNKTIYEVATEEWMDNYMKKRTAPLKLK
ncbi:MULTISPECIES: N(4)-(beta-N-acetylglucosaminyl)-L-asparaginase [Tissierellales]|jgi:N4-(beta-N-acetylglucosaminyl)-L-asparaginase|uniref:N(4)-(Beta-N-acetylglucosaminyl)-L-asparaginase n=1 Tax=Acidilutibacter cellobiosedens TaxID=2507161 RepID=A0A410QBL1_9FIRM|nr:MULTISPECIES: N(4)-(beta-N-acetylglucosaminyl)-L-asparaginase [Tissierellales]QAT61422.1 N(4)-(beta-N-acetylglucosaminyl)-L-asparaginase [Acidilutibacter cellobiosedens]SCL95707.1 N(4)-(Beta-N-acetylglucosaminyl)-L-asparaginaseprecursor [Sporanaerobacter sp. PP17-6a]